MLSPHTRPFFIASITEPIKAITIPKQVIHVMRSSR